MPELSPTASAVVDEEHDSGLEEEKEDENATIRRPFDPNKIKVRTVNVVVDQIISRIEHAEIDLAPGFQRMAGIWNNQRKSRLIESLLLRIPIPVFYVAEDENEKWSVVDGIQRISTIFDFVNGQFSLSQLEYLDRLNGNFFKELPRPMQRRIRETQFVVNVIEQGTPEEVMFNIFRRINTGGMALNGQEIRHALHPGPVRDYLRELAEDQAFLKATDKSVKPHRMADRECVLRFLAFHIDRWEQYSVNDLDGHLSRAMTTINRMTADQRANLSYDFEKAMRASWNMFGTYAFRKRYRSGDGKRRINKALFEAWSVGLARRSDDQIQILVKNKSKVCSGFIQLMNSSSEFHDAISTSTGTPARVRTRFREIDELIERCL